MTQTFQSAQRQPCEHNSLAAAEWPHLQLSHNTWLIHNRLILHKMIRILHPNVSFYPHIKTIYRNPDHCILLEVLWDWWKEENSASCLLMQPPCGIVKLLVCPNPSPLPSPPGHLTTKLCLSSIFIPYTNNAQCSKGSVTSGVREGGGCTCCLWKLPHG